MQALISGCNKKQEEDVFIFLSAQVFSSLYLSATDTGRYLTLSQNLAADQRSYFHWFCFKKNKEVPENAWSLFKIFKLKSL